MCFFPQDILLTFLLPHLSTNVKKLCKSLNDSSQCILVHLFFFSIVTSFSNCDALCILAEQNTEVDLTACFLQKESLLFWPWHSSDPSLNQFSSLKWGENKLPGSRREELHRWIWPFCLTAVVFLTAALLKTMRGLAQQTLASSLPS